MKNYLTVLLFTVLTIATFTAMQSKSLVIKGSDTVLPLSQQEAEEYMKTNKKESITVTGGGSGVGIAAFLNGTTDIAMASRSIKLKEKLKLKKANKPYVEKIVALDAIAVAVNKSNPVTQLTREQLEKIFTGEITNWSQVGGKNLKIVAYSRETSSGTYEYFKKKVLNKKNFGPKILLLPSNGAIVQSVSQTEGAIGYIGFAYINKNTKTLKVAFDGKPYYAPTFENAKSKKYPVSRALYYYYLKKDENKVKSFMNFVLSPKGQKIASEAGYIPVK